MGFQFPREGQSESPAQKNSFEDFLHCNWEEPGAQGVRDSSPLLPPASPTHAPSETRKEVPAYRAAPTRPGALSRVQTQSAPWREAYTPLPGGTCNPQYLMLPFGGGLLFHFRHKHTRHFPLHRAQTPHGRPNMQWEEESEPGTAPGTGRLTSQPLRSNHAHFTLKHTGTAHVSQHRAWGADVSPEAASWPRCLVGIVVLEPKRPHLPCWKRPHQVLRSLKKRRSVSGVCVCT